MYNLIFHVRQIIVHIYFYAFNGIHVGQIHFGETFNVCPMLHTLRAERRHEVIHRQFSNFALGGGSLIWLPVPGETDLNITGQQAGWQMINSCLCWK
jgi:hypothetical protein